MPPLCLTYFFSVDLIGSFDIAYDRLNEVLICDRLVPRIVYKSLTLRVASLINFVIEERLELSVVIM